MAGTVTDTADEAALIMLIGQGPTLQSLWKDLIPGEDMNLLRVLNPKQRQVKNLRFHRLQGEAGHEQSSVGVLLWPQMQISGLKQLSIPGTPPWLFCTSFVNEP